MANKELDDLTAAGAVDDADLMLILQGANSRKISIADLKAAIAGLVSADTWIAPHKGCLLKRTSELTDFASYPLVVSWQAAEYDSNGFFSLGAPTRITIPTGVTKARLTFSAAITNSATAHSIFTAIQKNGSTAFIGNSPQNTRHGSAGFSNNNYWTQTAVIPVVAGDYFEGRLNGSGTSGAMNDLLVDYSWFQLEVIEGDGSVL